MIAPTLFKVGDNTAVSGQCSILEIANTTAQDSVCVILSQYPEFQNQSVYKMISLV